MQTIPLYLMALVIAIANTPTNVYQVCAWNVGTVHAEPWRHKAASVARAARDGIQEWVSRWLRVATNECGEAAIDLLVPGIGASPLKALRQKAAQIHARLKELNDKATKAVIDATAPGLADEERAEVTRLKAEYGRVDELRQEAERLNEAERATKIITPDPDHVAAVKASQSTRLDVGEDELDKARKTLGFFGRQLQAVRRAALVLKGGDETLTAEDRRLLKMMAAPTGLNTDVPSEGGFVVDQMRSSTILQRSYETGAILSRLARQPIGAGSNGMKFPAIDETSRANNSRFGGIVSGWLGQGNTLSSGKPKFREIDLKLRKVGAFVYTTDEMEVDAIALEGWINRYLPLELTFRAEDAVINGTGSTQPLGVLNSPAVITVTRSQSSHVIYDDVSGMWKRLWAGARGIAGDASTTVWLVDQSVEQELEQLNIPIGTAGVLAPIYKPAGSTPGQRYASVYGRPVIPVEYCAALGTSGDIILVSLPEYVLIDKGGVDQAVSLHVAFLTDEAVYRFIYRCDGQLSWNAALTPKSAGSTLSPVIVLS